MDIEASYKEVNNLYDPNLLEELKYADPEVRSEILTPPSTNLMAKGSELMVICLGLIVGIWLLYGLGKWYANRRAKKKEVSAILNINATYKDLVEREETLQSDLIAVIEQQNWVSAMLKIFIVFVGLAGFSLWRAGKAYFAYVVQEMPHFMITLPLTTILVLYLWSARLVSRREMYLKEQADLKPKMREQEKLLRETIDPKLYDTFRRLIMQDEKEKIEAMKIHSKGCTEKCRVKHTALEMDMDRNKVLVEKLTSFDWCDRCNSGNLSQSSPPSGAKKSYPPCTNGCGARLVSTCKPLMQAYAGVTPRLNQLQERYHALEARDVSMSEYKEKKEKFKTDQRKARLNVDGPAGVDKFLDGMNMGGEQEEPGEATTTQDRLQQ